MTLPADADDVFDPAIVADLRRPRGPRGVDFFRMLLDAFRGEAPERVAAMRAAAAGGDAARLRTSAHALKGAAASLGARRVADLCVRLEQIGRAGGVGGAEALLDALEPQLRRVYEAAPTQPERRP